MKNLTRMFLWLLLLGTTAFAGTVEGTVPIDAGKLPPRTNNTTPDMKRSQSQYSKADLKKANAGAPGSQAGKEDERQNVIIYITKAGDGAKLKATPKRKEIVQVQREFQAHVTPLVLGSEVRYSNEDSFFHHIYCPESSKLNAPQHSTHVDRKPDRLGKFELFCDIHPLMNGYLYVVPNDFVTNGAGGKFSLTGLPPGNYTVEAWHPMVNAKSVKVTVPASGKATANFSL